MATDLPVHPAVDTQLLVDLLANEEPLRSREQAVEVLCVLMAVVANSPLSTFPDSPADCICANAPIPDQFRNDGDEVRHIVRVVLTSVGVQP